MAPIHNTLLEIFAEGLGRLLSCNSLKIIIMTSIEKIMKRGRYIVIATILILYAEELVYISPRIGFVAIHTLGE